MLKLLQMAGVNIPCVTGYRAETDGNSMAGHVRHGSGGGWAAA